MQVQPSASSIQSTFIGDAKRPDWMALLSHALACPGELSSAYRLFHNYSAGNIALITVEAIQRGEPLAPIASFAGWKAQGYHVKRGAKAYAMLMPVQVHSRDDEERGDDDEPDARRGKKTIFILKRNWFILHQVEAGPDAQPLQEPATPEWSLDRACQTLGIAQIPFDIANGNVQGYASAVGIAINPLARFPVKTGAHELAHVLLGHIGDSDIVDHEELSPDKREAEAESTAFLVAAMLGLDDEALSSSRAYIQAWLYQGHATEADAAEFKKRSASRIFRVANQILRAGQEIETAAGQE